MENDNQKTENEIEILKHMQRDISFLKNVVLQIREEVGAYPPENRIKKSIIKDVEDAQNRIRAGRGKAYTSEEFKAKFCE